MMASSSGFWVVGVSSGVLGQCRVQGLSLWIWD